MNRILFVDDDANVREGLKRMLYSLRKEWDMVFVSSGAEALGLLAESPFDVLVTDVRMPEMDGIELLQQVLDHYPEVIRLVLSGTAEIELTLQSVSLSHQYLMKPCDAATLRATMQRALCLRALLFNPALRGLISRIQSLPSIPSVYAELLEVLRSGEAAPSEVGRIMVKDMGMTAKVLQLVNSAYFGVSREISNPVEAVVYLGMETVRALAFTASAFSQFQVSPFCDFSIEELQKHSLAVGTLARRIAKSMSLSPAAVDQAFVGGLLHDIGKLVLAAYYPHQFQKARRRARESGVPLHEVEFQDFGTSHSEIGAYLLWLWGLPDAVADVLAWHHRPSRNSESAPSIAAVHVADALVNELPDEGIDMACLADLGVESKLPSWRIMYQEFLEVAVC